MDAKTAYETAGAIAEALPEEMREQYVALLFRVTEITHGDDGRANKGVWGWLRDAGWMR